MRATYTAIKKFDCSNDDSLGYIKNHKDQTNGKDTYSLFFSIRFNTAPGRRNRPSDWRRPSGN